MKLNYDRKSKDPTYFIQQGIRNGKKTTTRNVCRIGRHSELLKITDDPLAYAKQKVAEYNEKFKDHNKVSMEVKLDFSENLKSNGDLVSSSTSQNIGYFFLQQIYNDLNLNSFFENITDNSKISFNPNDVNRFLTYARILFPGSKLFTTKHLHTFYEQPNIDYIHIMRTMDILYQHYDEYIAHLFEQSNKIIKRNTAICYYDCTNYYFETECEDEDYVDEITGETIKGLRKYGISKEHRPNPIVEMGLFMDTDGIPLSMCLVSGSDNEQTTAIPLEKKLIKMFKKNEFIYCSDSGLGSYHIRNFNAMGGRAFVVTQSIKKLPKQLQKDIFTDSGFRLISNNEPTTLSHLKNFNQHEGKNLPLYNDRAYKVIYADKIINIGLNEDFQLKNGKTKTLKSPAKLKQKIIVTFSRKLCEYQRAVRKRQIDRATKLLKNLDPETYKKGNHDCTRFIKRIAKNPEGGKINETYELNTAVIAHEEIYDGFYAVATNLDDDAETILSINSNRYKIEDCFRVMKTNLASRPVFHQTRERITAHFLICYTALLVFRLLETKLNRHGKHFTTEGIIETVQNMTVANINDMFYASTYKASEICTALNAIFPLDLNKKYYTNKALNKKLKKYPYREFPYNNF